MRGVLLVNLGTPAAPTRAAVAAYLAEFLSDPRVIDLPRWLWIPLLRLVIIPLRARRSAEAYQKVWTPDGSPLLVFSRSLATKLAASLEGEAIVRLAMRYGQPGIEEGLRDLEKQGADELVVLPLYPQYSATTTLTVVDAVSEALRNLNWFPKMETIQKYHDQAAWIMAVADSVRSFQRINGRAEKLVFSLHGIPQRYVANGDPYAMQCEQSVSDIAGELGLELGEWMFTFQSRVGREPWLQPYTDITLKGLAQTGVRNIQVICPGFAVDCLETLEEIVMQNGENFIEAGGEKLAYIPALNDSEAHVALMSELIRGAFTDQSPR